MSDIDDRIYPRARNRIGPRYQAEVPGERLSPQKSDTPCSDRAVITPTANETGTVKEQHDTISRDSNAKLEAAADSSTEPEIKRSLSASPLLVPQKYPLPAVKQGPVPKMRGKRGRPKYRRRLDNGPGGHPHPQLNDMDEDKPIERGTSATVTPLFRPHKIQEADRKWWLSIALSKSDSHYCIGSDCIYGCCQDAGIKTSTLTFN